MMVVITKFYLFTFTKLTMCISGQSEMVIFCVIKSKWEEENSEHYEFIQAKLNCFTDSVKHWDLLIHL